MFRRQLGCNGFATLAVALGRKNRVWSTHSIANYIVDKVDSSRPVE